MLCNQEMAQVLEAFRGGLFAKLSGPQQTQLGGKLLGGTHLESHHSKLGPLHCLDKKGIGGMTNNSIFSQVDNSADMEFRLHKCHSAPTQINPSQYQNHPA